MTLRAAEKPCSECPWRRDIEPGNFPPERFAALAHTAQDMNPKVFQCHKTSDGKPLVCAGFLERGADHNFTIRMAYMKGQLEVRERSGGLPLYEDYREMAIANGLLPEDLSLDGCRSRGE